jgi:hypothetical protein
MRSNKQIPCSRFILHEPMCLKTVKMCKMCDEVINIEDEEDHIKEFHTKFKCSHCNKGIEKKCYEIHIKTCEERLLECIYCLLEISAKELKDHEYACGSKTENCHSCRKYIPIRDLEKHLQSPCYPDEIYLNNHIDIQTVPTNKKHKDKGAITQAAKLGLLKENQNKIVHRDLGKKIEEIRSKDQAHPEKEKPIDVLNVPTKSKIQSRDLLVKPQINNQYTGSSLIKGN